MTGKLVLALAWAVLVLGTADSRGTDGENDTNDFTESTTHVNELAFNKVLRLLDGLTEEVKDLTIPSSTQDSDDDHEGADDTNNVADQDDWESKDDHPANPKFQDNLNTAPDTLEGIRQPNLLEKLTKHEQNVGSATPLDVPSSHKSPTKQLNLTEKTDRKDLSNIENLVSKFSPYYLLFHLQNQFLEHQKEQAKRQLQQSTINIKKLSVKNVNQHQQGQSIMDPVVSMMNSMQGGRNHDISVNIDSLNLENINTVHGSSSAMIDHSKQTQTPTHLLEEPKPANENNPNLKHLVDELTDEEFLKRLHLITSKIIGAHNVDHPQKPILRKF